MTSITIAHTPESKIATVANAVLNSLSSLRGATSAAPQPFLMKPDTTVVTWEDVERKLSQPAWRSMGRYL